MDASLSELADYAARLWLRETRPPSFLRAGHSKHRREHAQLIRYRVKRRDFLAVFYALGTEGGLQFSFLERAFPHLSDAERTTWLQYVWCRTKTSTTKARALRLVRAVPQLRDAIPKDWPNVIRVYRGAWGGTWDLARRQIRRGLSWTTDRDVAMKFVREAQEFRTSGLIAVTAIGTTEVSRLDVLAYFDDEDYQERECIIDPASVAHVAYARIEPKEAS